MKSLYGFRLFLKKRAAEFKKTVGEEVGHGKRKATGRSFVPLPIRSSKETK